LSVALLAWLLGVSTTLFSALLIAILTGQMVPASRADRAESVAEVQKETIASQNRTNIVQAELITQLQTAGLATERLITALKAVIPPQNGGQA